MGIRLRTSEEMKDIEEREIKEILSKAKFPKELLLEVYGKVLEINGYNESMRHTPQSEMIIGGRSPSYDTGYQNRLEMSLQSEILPVKKIIFWGNSIVQSGDYIKAGIFVGVKAGLSFLFKNIPEDKRIFVDQNEHLGEIHYVLMQRDFKEEEEALYLKIIRNEEEVRTDFSVNYNPKFFA